MFTNFSASHKCKFIKSMCVLFILIQIALVFDKVFQKKKFEGLEIYNKIVFHQVKYRFLKSGGAIYQIYSLNIKYTPHHPSSPPTQANNRLQHVSCNGRHSCVLKIQLRYISDYNIFLTNLVKTILDD